MATSQQAHITQVMQAVGLDDPPRLSSSLNLADAFLPKDSIIHDSWTRCVSEHQLDPTRMQEAVILPNALLREHQDQMDAFLHIARHGLEALYRQVAGLGYCVLLTDAKGVTVDFLGDLVFEPSLRKAGLYLGADWSEHHAGTCGVGTCIATGEALTVHLDDHFDATHIPLTCTAAPVFDDQGHMKAVLDISALSSPTGKDSQHLALQMVKMYAGHVENASFLQRYRAHWILRLSRSPEFLDVSPEYLLALDDAGRVVGHNRQAQLMLSRATANGIITRGLAVHALIGRPLSTVLNLHASDLGRYLAGLPVDQRAVTVPGSKEMLFLSATPPPSRPKTLHAQTTQSVAVPAPLAALSAGDPVIDRITERAARLVNSPINILLTGETGSGKERFARALHESSERRRQPFVAVNCAAIPETLIESELFGYLPGSFSGAGTRGKRGLIQEADGGTLFLDEIGDMPLPLQGRLLRVLAEREVLPIGATKPLAVNLRVVAATHCNLVSAVKAGRFRDDLYYRLSGVNFHLPPLRERQDLPKLIERLCAQSAQPVKLTQEAMDMLLTHDWPGNLRELCNVLDCARALCNHGWVTVEDLPEHLTGRPPGHLSAVWSVPASEAAEDAAEDVTEDVTEDASPSGTDPVDAMRALLRESGGNMSEAARRLGVSRMTLYRRMARLGLRPPSKYMQ